MSNLKCDSILKLTNNKVIKNMDIKSQVLETFFDCWV